MRQEEARRMARILEPGWSKTIEQVVKPDQNKKIKEGDNTSSQIKGDSTAVKNLIAESNRDNCSLAKTSISNIREEPNILNRASPEQAVSDLVNNTSCIKSLSPKMKQLEDTVSTKTSKRSSEDFWVLEQSGTDGNDDTSQMSSVLENDRNNAYPIKKECGSNLKITPSHKKVKNTEHEEIEEGIEDIDPVAHFLEAKEVLEEELAGCNLFWPKSDQQTQGCAYVEGQEVLEGNPVETMTHEMCAVKKFCCMECGKELNTKNGLDYHMRTHSGAHPFQCEICLKRFKSSSLCSRHRQIHSSDKKFSCKICGKGFAQKSNLSKHMDIHAGVRPFQVHSIFTVT